MDAHRPWFRISRLALVLAVGAGVWTVVAAAAETPSPRVVILRPRPTEVLVGKSVVAILVDGVADDQIQRVRIRIDGEPLETLTHAPWRLSFDAGDEVGRRTIDVDVDLLDGSTLSATLTTKPAGVGRVDVRIVDLAVTVVDEKGKTVTGLQQEDFKVFDNGQPIQIERWGDKPADLAVAMVLDTSLSMRSKLADVKRAAKAFIGALGPKDQVAVVAFSETSTVVRELSTNKTLAKEVIDGLSAQGGTALYDALYDAGGALHAASSRQRRIAVVLSDGRDESASGLEPGSFHTLQEAVHKAHDNDLIVFTIGLGADLGEPDFSGRMTHGEALARMAKTTGGRFFRLRRLGRLTRVYRSILDELRHQYYIAYRPPEPRPGEKWHTIRVEVADPALSVRTREGYFVR